jgi:hypothetical protein
MIISDIISNNLQYHTLDIMLNGCIIPNRARVKNVMLDIRIVEGSGRDEGGAETLVW